MADSTKLDEASNAKKGMGKGKPVSKEISKSTFDQLVSQSLISFGKVKLSLRILALHCVLLSHTLASSNQFKS